MTKHTYLHISGTMRKSAWLFLFLCSCLLSFAQAPRLLRQQKLSKWQIPAANYSGITPLGGDLYAVVDDKAAKDGFCIFRIEVDSVKGRVTKVELVQQTQEIPQQKRAHDAEGVCYVPETQTVFVSSEDNQRIVEYNLDGKLTGRELMIPSCFGTDSIYGNAGFEPLAYDALRRRFVTTTETNLRNEGIKGRHRLQTFGLDLRPKEQFPYQLDEPAISKKSQHYIHGIAAICADSDGSWLVLEREISIKKRYIGSKVHTKIYRVTPNDTKQPLAKTLVCEFTSRIAPFSKRFANYEGMCLGPRLKDGRQTLLLIADSQGGAGNSLYRLHDYLKVIILP